MFEDVITITLIVISVMYITKKQQETTSHDLGLVLTRKIFL